MNNTNTDQLPEVFLSEPQNEVYQANTPLILELAGQGGGKTKMIGFISKVFITNYPEVKGFIGANTEMQISQSTLTNVFATWKEYFNWSEYDKIENPNGNYVINKIPPAHFKTFHKLDRYNKTISFANGCLVYTGSLENYKAHDGKEFGWGHLDETKDTKKEALTTVILARLRQFGLWIDKEGSVFFDKTVKQEDIDARGLVSWNPLYIHTSPAEGSVDWLLEMFDLEGKEAIIKEAIEDPYKYYIQRNELSTTVIYQTYWNEDNLPPAYIKTQEARMSKNERLKWLCGYPFSKSGGEFYPSFDRLLHVRPLEIDTTAAFHLTYDFNVLPYVTQLLAQIRIVTKWIDPEGKKINKEPKENWQPFEQIQIHFKQEYCERNKPPRNQTSTAAQDFVNDYGYLMPDVFIYGDGSGNNRITGMPEFTQYKIIEQHMSGQVGSFNKMVKNTNISPVARRNFIDKVFSGIVKEVEVLIDPNCKELIRDFDFLKEGVNGKLKEKEKNKHTGQVYEKIGHTSDAAEYLICEVCREIMKIYK